MATDAQHPNPAAQTVIPGTDASTQHTNGAGNGTALADQQPGNAAAAEEVDVEVAQTEPKRRKRRGGSRKGGKWSAARRAAFERSRAAESKPKGRRVAKAAKSTGNGASELDEALATLMAPAAPSIKAIDNLHKHLVAKAEVWENAAKSIRQQALKVYEVKSALSRLAQ